jgi:O-antigen/teichoic acid export membrane protein
MLKLSIVYLFGSVFFGTFKDIFLGFQQIFLFSFTEFMKNISIFFSVLLFFYLGKGPLTPVLAYVLTSVIISLFFFPFVLRRFNFFKYKITHFNKISRDLVLFSLPVFATAAGGKIIAYVDTLLLTYYRSLSEVGIYNAVLPSSMIFTHFVAGAIASMVFPLSSELWYKNDIKKLAEGIRLLHKYLFVFTIPLVFPVIAFAHYFILIFFGNSYLEGVVAFQILSIGMFLWTMASINNNVLTAIGKPKEVMKIIFYAAILNFGLNLVLIPKYGIEGAAVSTTLSYMAGLFLSTFKLCSILMLSFPWKQWSLLAILTTIFSVVMFELMYFVHWSVPVALVVSIIFSVILYILLLFCFHLVDLSELKKYLTLVFQKGEK